MERIVEFGSIKNIKNKKMMKQLTLNSIIAIFLCGAFFCGCNNESGFTVKTKLDSIKLAKEILNKYPEVREPLNADFGNNPSKSFGGVKFNPIDFSLVQSYANNYDAFPLIRNKRGFLIDAKGLNLIKGNTRYKQIYLRFGKYSNSAATIDDYTVMIIPLSADSSVLHRGAGSATIGANSNYDELDPCPSVCPKGFN